MLYAYPAMKGTFITFEGVEGCGKTTQIRLLADCLKRKGQEVVLTREPGGTAIGDRIRAILLDAAHDGMAPVAELLLYAAARNQHVTEVIGPALEDGKIVLCDRYADATTAYQGAARRIDPEVIRQIHSIATGGLDPHLTILLDCAAEAGLARAHARNSKDAVAQSEDRFEREEMEFHKRVREGYLAIALAEPKRVVVIDAARDAETIHQEILKAVEKSIG
ncbi:MAG: dTMP kinase [Pseudomonadota bacterium]